MLKRSSGLWLSVFPPLRFRHSLEEDRCPAFAGLFQRTTVGMIGLEPIHPYGTGFTVRPNSPNVGASPCLLHS